MGDIAKWIPDAAIIAASVTAMVAFVSKVLELLILWRNKKKEIDYDNNMALNNEIRRYSAEIVVCISQLMTHSTMLILLVEYLEDMGESKEHQKALEEKIDEVNENSRSLIYHIVQLELHILNGESGNAIVEKAHGLQERVTDIKKILDRARFPAHFDTIDNLKEEYRVSQDELNLELTAFTKIVRKYLSKRKIKV